MPISFNSMVIKKIAVLFIFKTIFCLHYQLILFFSLNSLVTVIGVDHQVIVSVMLTMEIASVWKDMKAVVVTNVDSLIFSFQYAISVNVSMMVLILQNALLKVFVSVMKMVSVLVR